MKVPSNIENFISRDDLTGCWVWRGELKAGAPVIREEGRRVRVTGVLSRVGNQQLTTTCGNTLCVSPEHTVLKKSLFIERFWSFVEKRGEDECWEWKGATDSGYGVFSLDLRVTRATHVALMLDGRRVQDGGQALHSCDNPPCVNPRHLRPGTNAENVADMVSKGRQGRKLTLELARSIRDIRSRNGTPYYKIAAQFGVSKKLVMLIVSNEIWREL